jgi:hypothetical protein
MVQITFLEVLWPTKEVAAPVWRLRLLKTSNHHSMAFNSLLQLRNKALPSPRRALMEDTSLALVSMVRLCYG